MYCNIVGSIDKMISVCVVKKMEKKNMEILILGPKMCTSVVLYTNNASQDSGHNCNKANVP